MAVASGLDGANRHVIAVIGDGSMSAGMAYEALNNAGSSDARLIVILNDNDMSIAPPVGAMSAYLSRLISSKSYRSIRHFGIEVAKKFPRGIEKVALKAEEYARGLVTGGILFEEMGFYYVGPVDGHNLDHLLPILRNIRDDKVSGPVLLHVVTKKGHGYGPAEASPDKYHGVGKFDVVTGEIAKTKSNAPSYTKVFAQALIAEATKDESIVAINAAMPAGTGLDKFDEEFPERCFDVGIAEQHAVTFAAGMASEGFKPFVAIYSTFLQRAYDQIVHDVAIQKLPVRFAIDRAGYVGADGATHCGAFDLAYLCCLPGFVVMAPADEAELVHAVATAASIDDGPCAFRYPRGEGVGVDLPEVGEVMEIGKGRMIREGSTVALLSLGTRLTEAEKAADELTGMGLSVSLADARFAKPLDEEMIGALAKGHEVLITIEDGSVGGFGAQVMQYLSSQGLMDNGLKFRSLVMADKFLDQDSVSNQYDASGLNAPQIVETVLKTLGRTDAKSSAKRA